jgi:hypothetical protein
MVDPETDPAAETGQPALAITAGRPTAEEIAAVVTVLFAAQAPAGAAEFRPAMRSGWGSKSWQLRQPVRRGPGAWRASARPQLADHR